MKKTSSNIYSAIVHPVSFCLRTYYKLCKPEKLLKALYTPADQAVDEIWKRFENEQLKQKVEMYLKGDIPSHFKTNAPIFYFSRFFATPNYETFHVQELALEHKLNLVISQDSKSKFSTNNILKVSLGKLPVVKGISNNNDVIIEYFTIIDFNRSNGKQLKDIYTKNNESLAHFHMELFNQATHLKQVTVVDETDWVDRNYRDNILKQYKQMFALVCVYGIMLESFTVDEYDFLRENVFPAFKEVEKEIGVRPLIIEHINEKEELERDWNSYPTEFYEYIKNKLHYS